MNTISINNKTYVKATDIARELGYTTDYVGQLCRAGKVDAELVGRSWYVNEDSLRDHKKNRYRSTKTASKKTIATSLKTKDMDTQESFKVPVDRTQNISAVHYAQESFYTRVPLHKTPSYIPDESELIPNASKIKTGKLSISLGDAQAVRIRSHAKEYDFNPTERPELRFRGTVAVKEIYEEDKEEQEEQPSDIEKKAKNKGINGNPVALTTTDPSTLGKPHLKKQHPAQKKIHVRHLRKDKKRVKKNAPVEHNTSGVIGMKASRIKNRNPIGGTLKVPLTPEVGTADGSGTYFVFISMAFSVFVAFLVMSLQSNIHISETMITASYTLNFDTVLALAFEAWKF